MLVVRCELLICNGFIRAIAGSSPDDIMFK
jgi:hypothetical protein